MLEAVLRQGVIVPLGPLPPEWNEGAVLHVVRAEESELDIDAWAQEMNEACADRSEENEAIMHEEIDMQRSHAAFLHGYDAGDEGLYAVSGLESATKTVPPRTERIVDGPAERRAENPAACSAGARTDSA